MGPGVEGEDDGEMPLLRQPIELHTRDRSLAPCKAESRTSRPEGRLEYKRVSRQRILYGPKRNEVGFESRLFKDQIIVSAS